MPDRDQRQPGAVYRGMGAIDRGVDRTVRNAAASVRDTARGAQQSYQQGVQQAEQRRGPPPTPRPATGERQNTPIVSNQNTLGPAIERGVRNVADRAPGAMRTATDWATQGDFSSPEGVGRTARASVDRVGQDLQTMAGAARDHIGGSFKGAYDQWAGAAQAIADPVQRFGRGFMGSANAGPTPGMPARDIPQLRNTQDPVSPRRAGGALPAGGGRDFDAEVERVMRTSAPDGMTPYGRGTMDVSAGQGGGSFNVMEGSGAALDQFRRAAEIRAGTPTQGGGGRATFLADTSRPDQFQQLQKQMSDVLNNRRLGPKQRRDAINALGKQMDAVTGMSKAQMGEQGANQRAQLASDTTMQKAQLAGELGMREADARHLSATQLEQMKGMNQRQRDTFLEQAKNEREVLKSQLKMQGDAALKQLDWDSPATQSLVNLRTAQMDKILDELQNGDDERARTYAQDYLGNLQTIGQMYPEGHKTRGAIADLMQEVLSSFHSKREGFAEGGLVEDNVGAGMEGYAMGGAIPYGGTPQAEQLDPAMKQYGQYAATAMSHNVKPVPPEQFMDLMQQGRQMMQQSPAQGAGATMGFALGGEVPEEMQAMLGMDGGMDGGMPPPGMGAMGAPGMEGMEGMPPQGAIPVSGQQVFDGTGEENMDPVDTIPAVIDGERPAALRSGEYVIPPEVVKAKGTEFFDKLIAQYMKQE